MATSEPKDKLKGALKKTRKSSHAGPAEPNNGDAANTAPLHFALPQAQDQRVTVFDSSLAPEPFLDSVGLENLRKRQQTENAAQAHIGTGK